MPAFRVVCNFCLLLILSTSCNAPLSPLQPSRTAHYVLSEAVIPVSAVQEVVFTSGTDSLAGVFVRQPDTLRILPHPTVIIHHESSGNITSHWRRAELFYRAGFDVFMYDYRGYGKSSGVANTSTLVNDALAADRCARTRLPIDTNHVVHYGHGHGAAGAVACAYRTATTHIILESANALFGRTTSALSLTSVPTLIIHGENDNRYPISAHGDVLYHVARQPKNVVRVRNAGTDNIPEQMGVQAYVDLIVTFVRGM